MRARTRLLAAVATALLGTGALAGCGASESSPAATTRQQPGSQGGAPGGGPPGLSSAQRAQFERFQTCLSRHGVTLPTGPQQGGSGPPQMDPAAMQACRKYLPAGGPQGGPPGGAAPPSSTS